MNFSTPGITPTKKTNSLRNACTSLLLVIVLMFVGQMSFAQITGDYRSNATPVDLNSATNWQVFSGGSFITATLPPNGNVVSGNTITILSGHTWNNPGPSPTIPAGVTILNQGTTGTFSTAAGNKINLNGTYIHNTASGNSAILAGVNNNTGSTVIFRGSSTIAITPSISGRTFYNMTIESSSGLLTTGAAAGATALIINGNLDIGGTGAGTVAVDQSAGTMAITVVGNISVKASCTYKPPTGIFTISGNITNAGTFTLNSASSVVFDGSTTLSGANLVSFANGFTVNATKTFANSQNGNIVASGKTATINGTFQVNEGSWTGSTGTYSYNAASGTLVFNNSSGAYGPIDNSHLYWPSANGPFNVTVQNTGGINLNVARTVAGSVITSKGIAGAGNLTVNGSLQINGGGFLTGTPTYGGSSTLIYNTTSYTTTTNEFPNTGVKNVTITAPSGTNTVTLDNDKVINGTFAIGAHTVNGGKSINAATITIGTGSLVAGTLTTSSSFVCSGASSISLTGSWSVTGFTKSTSTVNFTGTGNLNNATNFYNLTNSAGTRSIIANFDVENTLLVSGGNITVSGGSGKSLTMSGAAATINITTGSIFGTDAGAGNDLTLVVSGTQTTLTGNATGVNDDEKKFFNVTVNSGSTLALARGILCKYGTFTVNGTLQINANGYVNTSGAYGGNAKSPGYNVTTGSLTYNNGGPYGTAGEWPTTNPPANVSVIAAGTDVQLSGNRTISGILTLTNGTITTSSNTLIVSNSATAAVVRTNGFVIGNLQRAVATGTNTYAYAVGTSSGYTPASIAFSGTTGAGNVTVVSLNGASSNYPSALSVTKRVARYWTVTNSGVSGFTAAATFTYLGADLVGGATQSSVKPYKFDAPSTFSYPSSSTGTLSFTESGITSFSEFGAGECGTVTVNPITGGGASLCIGATQQLASTTPGGVWTSDAPSIASVSVGGLVTANLNGTTTIHYTVTDISGCTGEATQSVTVLPNYTITASAGSGGSISPNGATTVCSGNNQTYTITAADACHAISNVLVDGVSVGAVGTYTFTNVTANHTISATFVLTTYTITATSGANGTVTPAGASTVNCGANATYTITPAACYAIADVLVDGVSVGAVGTYTFTNVTANHTISATFILTTYTITATSGANGSVTPAGASTVNCGDNATYTITPAACYAITDVLVDGVSVGAVGTYTFTNVTAAHTISASFVLNTYTITVTAGANGSITPATGSVNCGSNATYTITANSCYSIADVLVDGLSVGAVGTYTFTNVTANHTISATFVLTTYTITATSGANGTVTPAGASTVNCGANATYTITPAACYAIADVLVDGVSVGAVGTYTFTNVTANHTISATFVQTTYTITATSGANGTVTPAGASTVNCGDNATYTITPAACYAIADVLVDGVSVGAVGTYTFTNVTANHTISATFVLTTYTITATSGANGTVTPAGASTVNCGDNATYTITPAACYAIADVLVDGVSVGAVGTFTFTNVTANHTISATFVQTTYTITATSGANGTVTPAGASTVNCGDNATYTITPAACYAIADVLVDGVSVGAVGTYTFTNVTANHTISATFVQTTYTITATSGANGTVTPAGASTVNCGDNATYTITPAACYAIADVLVDGVSVGAVGTFTFTNVTANHTISATFVQTTYTITATSGANGTVTPAGASTVNCGDNATYTITPAACYAIADVLVDGVSVGAVGTFTFTNVTANHTISATFVLTTYTITATSGANGTVTPAGASTVNCGDNATYTITPAACYAIADVLVDGVSVGAVGTYTFTNVTANHTISATFVLTTYTITATSGANGTVTPAGASTVNCGANATYTITPAACYAIADVLVDGVSVGAVGTYTFTNVTANHTISATFVQTTYTITATSGANGTVTPAGASTVNCGDNSTYTITPAACYAIADVLVDGVSVGAVGTYTFTNVTANHTISATFSLNTYTITATSGANGTVTPAGASTVNCGDNATYTITPAACYAIADVLVDGVSVGAVGTYTFTNVTANHTISATFVLTNYTITATSGANGTVTPAGASTVNCGDNATYTITANACYSIADVLVDGVSVGAVGTYTFTNVTANHTISATFSLNTYTITATSGANGTVTPAGASTVNCGANATYTITPAACYAIADVLVDGVSVGAVGTYTFTNVTANHTISATFVQTTYTITATSGANGTVTPAGASTVNCGANATYTITPAACYAIADVLVDGVSVGAVGTYTFTNVTANHTISATFVQTTYTITATSGANGTVTPAGASTVNCGDNATYTITANACYSIADVLVDGVSVGAVGTYTFTNVTANHTISATFVQTTYTITATSGANGTVTPAGASTVNCGANATYTITPAACYAIADVLVDGVSVGAVGTYTFTNVTANHTISATFVQTTYTITATSGANGTVTPAGASTVNCGDNATYTITPAACYAIADVLVDGVSVGAVGTYTFTNVTANHTISATFVLTTYTITATSGANGTVTPAGASTVNCGANATYSITPAPCYAIADVLVDGVSVGAVGTYTFTNVTANHTISATFVQTTYTITATSGANGTVTPAGASTVNCGANATYTITPAACYAIADVLVDGVSVGAIGTYTFTNVTANHTISATFVLNTYTITVTAGANGSITPATGSVNCGSNATYTITPNACYAIANVIVDGVSQGAVGTYTFTNVTANHTISATFVLANYTITVTAGANGSITPGTGSVNCGANATYTITANACYSIANVIVDGVSQGAVGTYTFTNVTANHTISATFSLNTYAITVTAGANGTITPGTGSVNCGSNATYTITANACYHINDVVVDGVSQGAVGTYTFTNVTATHTISASFVANNPLTAPVVTGPVNVCPYIGSATQLTYTVPAVPGATSYNWTVPTSVTIVSGQGTPSLVVTIGNTFQATPNKQIRISVATTCGTTPQTIYVLVAQAPNTPQPITGPTSVCPIIGTPATFTYTIAPVLNATSYIWAAQAGTTTITHPNGPGVNDTIVNVSFTNGFTSSNITVRAANDSCGASNVRSLPLTKANPSAPGLIAGSTNACPYMAPGGIPATYSVAAVVGQTYTWTVPAGAIGLTGQGTNAISFTYPASFVSGTISVTTTNGCGTSGARTLSINKLLPATPGVIDVIQTQPCPNRIYTYTISATPASSTSVQWTVPVGATLVSGQGTNSITVSYPGTAFNSNVTAQSFNNCGSSTIRSTPVHLPTCVEEKQSNTFTKGGTTTAPAAEAMKVNVYPNPTVSDFKLQVVTAGKQTINVRIADAQGRNIKTFEVMPYNTINVGSDLKAGAYMMEVRQGNEVKVTKLLKF